MMNKILIALVLAVVMSGNVNAQLRTVQRVTTCQSVENQMEGLLKNYGFGDIKKAERKSVLEDIKLLSEIFDNYCKD